MKFRRCRLPLPPALLLKGQAMRKTVKCFALLPFALLLQTQDCDVGKKGDDAIRSAAVEKVGSFFPLARPDLHPENGTIVVLTCTGRDVGPELIGELAKKGPELVDELEPVS